MPPYAIHEVATPAEPTPTTEILELHALEGRELVDFFGHDDLLSTPEAMTRSFCARDTADKWWLTARADDGTLVGAAPATLPRRDNTTLVELEFAVDPQADRPGVVRALWSALEPRVREAGRSAVHLWQMHRPGQSGAAGTVSPTTDEGAIVADAWSDTFTELGFTLAQVERHSDLDIAAHRDRWPALAAEAAARAADYELVTWFGATPEELLEPMARLHRRMSVDVPTGGLAYEEEDWDADRLREQDRRAAESEQPRLVTLARHRPSGEATAYTELTLPEAKPAVAWQGDTLVHGDHRGRRLGMLVKTANLAELLRRRPTTERVHTWNADENQWMLAINIALGFTPASASGAWRIDLD